MECRDVMLATALVVDDDRGFRGQLRRLLGTPRDVRVLEAADGEEAVRLVSVVRPEIVLMDIAMPRMDGLEATRRIKAVRGETKVIMLTVHDEEPYRQAARECGADAFVVKKSVAVELIPWIRSLVPGFPAAAAARPPDSAATDGTAAAAP